MSLFLPRRGGFTADNDMHRANIRALEAWSRTRATDVLKIKNANQLVTNSTTLVDDDTLFLEVLPNEVWAVDFYLYTAGGGTPDFKAAFTIPTGATFMYAGFGPEESAATANAVGVVNLGVFANSVASTYGLVTGTDMPIHLRGVLRNGPNGGKLQLQWAQKVADATSCGVTVNSHMIAKRFVTQ